MKYVMVSVFDVALGSFGRPLFVQSIGAAVRSFGDEINRVAPDNEMSRHPEDYSVYELGEFHDEEGKFVILDIPRLVCRGSDMTKAKKES